MEATELRQLVGLQPGRIVNYVMKDGSVRPLIIVQVWTPNGYINGVLFFDGTNDSGNMPNDQVHELPGGVKSLCVGWVTSVNYSEDKEPGTWHWPARQSAMAPVAAATADNMAAISELQSQMLTLTDLSERLDKSVAEMQSRLGEVLLLSRAPAATSDAPQTSAPQPDSQPEKLSYPSDCEGCGNASEPCDGSSCASTAATEAE